MGLRAAGGGSFEEPAVGCSVFTEGGEGILCGAGVKACESGIDGRRIVLLGRGGEGWPDEGAGFFRRAGLKFGCCC